MRLAEVVAELDLEHRRRITACLDLLRQQTIYSARLQGEVEVLEKEDRSPVTVIDLLHQSQVQELLAGEFAADALICEEPAALQAQVLDRVVSISEEVYGIPLQQRVLELPRIARVTWVLDPIDGTKGFLGGRYFAIAIGYFVDGVPFFGALAVPGAPSSTARRIDRTMAFGIRGKGAWITSPVADGEPSWRALRSEPWSGGGTRIAVSLAHGGPLVERLQQASELELVKLDSQAKYLAVATGEIDAYLRAARDDGFSDVVWDHMPAGLLAVEAGCEVRDFAGAEVLFEARTEIVFDGGVLCVRPSVEDRLLGAVLRLVA